MTQNQHHSHSEDYDCCSYEGDCSPCCYYVSHTVVCLIHTHAMGLHIMIQRPGCSSDQVDSGLDGQELDIVEHEAASCLVIK